MCEVIPCFERVRFTGSGTEATMHCIRLARAFTGRQKLLKFEGNFHGYHDQVMFAIGTPADQLGPEATPNPYPGSTGIAAGLQEQLVVVPYNRVDLLEAAFAKHAHELAAVIGEPIYYNAGCIIPIVSSWRAQAIDGAARRLNIRRSVALFAWASARKNIGVTPDLCTLGKAVMAAIR